MRRYANRRIGRGLDASAGGRGRAGPVAFAGEDRRTVEPRTRYRHGRRADHALGNQAGPSGSGRIIGKRPRIRPAGGPVPTATGPPAPRTLRDLSRTAASRRGIVGQNAVSPWAAFGSRPRQPAGPSGSDRIIGKRPRIRPAEGPVPTATGPRRPGRCATSAGRRHPGEGSYGQNAVSPWAACGSRPRPPGRTFGERLDHRQAAPYPPGRRSGPDRDGPPAPRTLRDLSRTAASRRGIVRAGRRGGRDRRRSRCVPARTSVWPGAG